MATDDAKTTATRGGEADHGVVVANEWYDDWIKDIPDQSDKVAIITGANSGTGFWAANALASKGCSVILACRNETKANAAKDEIISRFKDAKVDVIVLDNMDLSTVKSFVKTFNSKYDLRFIRILSLTTRSTFYSSPKMTPTHMATFCRLRLNCSVLRKTS